MATTRQAKKAGPVRAWFCIEFHGGIARKMRRLKDVEGARGWPGGASVMRLDRVKKIKGPKRKHAFNAFVEIEAADYGALDRVFDYIEAHFSHVDVYEF